MSSIPSNEFKETVRAQTDLVGLISESISLNSAHGGREFVGLCPFHDDHNPSMRVYPDRQSFRCWVCQAGGDCFTWVMEYDKVEFREALEILARRANVPIPAFSRSAGSVGSDQKAKLFEALQWAQNVFHETLLNEAYAARALEYLRGRGFSDETIRRWKLGFQPDDWDWLQRRAENRYSLQTLEAAKLITKNSNGPGYSDFFRGRVLFPICNERGQTLSFGGRVLPGGDESRGKYKNGPESVVYHKSRTVYGLHHARETIRETGTIVAVEGYTDCISAHQAGLTNAVATCGTALTDQHVTTMKRFARKIVLIFDGDDAGRMAAEKAVARFLAQDADLRILTLPAGKDPADFLSEHSADYLRELADQAPEAWEYKFQSARARHGNNVDARQRILEEMLDILAVVPKMSEHVREGMLLGDLANRLLIPEPQVRERYQEIRKRAANSVRVAPRDETPTRARADVVRIVSGRSTRDDRLECELLEIVFTEPSLARFLLDEVPPDAVRNEALRTLLSTCYFILGKHEEPSFEHVMNALEDGELKRLAVWIDDQAREKDLQQKLHDSPVESPDDCPPFLRRAIENVKWRREEQSHGRTVVELSGNTDGAQRMDPAAEALLRQHTEFHQKRATRKTPV